MNPIINATIKALIPTILIVGSFFYLNLNFASEDETTNIDIFRTSVTILLLLIFFTLPLLGSEYRKNNPEKYKESIHPLESPFYFVIWILLIFCFVSL